MEMKSVPVPILAEDFKQDVIGLLHKYSGELSSVVMFAVTCQLAGQIAAHLDGRSITSGEVMALFTQNFQLGNAAAVESIIKSSGGRN